MLSKVIAIAVSGILLMGSAANARCPSYKTIKKRDVVITGLQPKKVYDVQDVMPSGKQKTLHNQKTNSCGELVFSGKARHRSFLLEGYQPIDVASLPKYQYHNRCNRYKPQVCTIPQNLSPVHKRLFSIQGLLELRLLMSVSNPQGLGQNRA